MAPVEDQKPPESPKGGSGGVEETATQLNKRIDDTNARFDGLQKLIGMMAGRDFPAQRQMTLRHCTIPQ
jgi:hypothetical protein